MPLQPCGLPPAELPPLELPLLDAAPPAFPLQFFGILPERCDTQSRKALKCSSLDVCVVVMAALVLRQASSALAFAQAISLPGLSSICHPHVLH